MARRARLVTPQVGLAAPADAESLVRCFDRVRERLGVRDRFPDDVVAAAAAAEPHWPDVDLTDVPFVTVDPPGSTDLDQAMALSRRGEGYLVRYAIADVPAFIDPHGPVAAEALRRGQTFYAPDRRSPLHPPTLSEDAASLLPGRDRPAFVWRFDLDAAGEVSAVDVVRAVVHSRHQLTYEQVHAATQSPVAADVVSAQAHLLREIGERRIALERARGGATLPLPEQEVIAEDGGYTMRLRPPNPAEDWNAQLSLMTGMAAASIMLEAGVGVLRTLPLPQAGTLARFRRQARALGVTWPPDTPYGEFLRTLDPAVAAHLGLLHEAAALFRGAGYTVVDGGPPDRAAHAAVAAPYAHVTAPLRRLVDRFGLVLCHAACQGEPVPEWVRAGLGQLPAVMAGSDRTAAALERGCLDAVEAAVLAHRVGEEFEAVVVDVDEDGGGEVQVIEPVVLAACGGRLTLGKRVRVRLEAADPGSGTVRFAVGDRQGEAVR